MRLARDRVETKLIKCERYREGLELAREELELACEEAELAIHRALEQRDD